MTVFVLIQEHQNDHGFIDTSITGVFQHEHDARQREVAEGRHALEQGLVIEDDDSSDVDWQVCWRIESHILS